MKAVVLKKYDTPFVLEEIARPVAGPGEVLIAVKASAVNPLDLKIKAGKAGHAEPRLPAILGIDMAGVVEAVGQGVGGFSAGDEVYGMTGGIAGIPGSLAEYQVVDARLLALKPRALSFREAAAMPLGFITAWEGLVDRAQVGPGKTVLVHGGAGGVGHLAVQLAVAKGAAVYATVRPERAPLIESYGAVPIDYTSQSAAEYMQRYTHGRGFDIVFDTLGGETLNASFLLARRYTGHVVSILGWGTHALGPLSFRGATYSGVFTLYPLISGEGREHHGHILREAAALVTAGRLRPLVDTAGYRLANVEAAYTAQEEGKMTGKIVIDVA
ncbi:MAG TPA: zinc-dependent alcohol dehydrogenase family protein [Puia sp.]